MTDETVERDDRGSGLARFAFRMGGAFGALIGLLAGLVRLTAIGSFWWAQMDIPLVSVSFVLFEAVLLGFLMGLAVAAVSLLALEVVEGRPWLRWLLAAVVGVVSGAAAGGYLVFLFLQRQSPPAAIITLVLTTCAVSWGYARVLNRASGRETVPGTIDDATAVRLRRAFGDASRPFGDGC